VHCIHLWEEEAESTAWSLGGTAVTAFRHLHDLNIRYRSAESQDQNTVVATKETVEQAAVDFRFAA
jgi:hypothetical protein